MKLYRSVCNLMDSLGAALTAWAEGERLNTLEYQFDMADGDGDQ